MRSRALIVATALLLLALPALAELVVVYDPDDPIVPGRVLSAGYQHPYLPGTRTLIPNALFDPDVAALTGIPAAQWKRVGAAVVAMTPAELDAIAAAEQAASQAQAQASYGVVGCDLVEGDSIIGVCGDGTVVTSPRLASALDDWLKRRISVQHGQYLARWNDTIVGAPAMPSGRRVEVAGPVAVNGTEQAIATLVDVPLNTPVSRVWLTAVVNLAKDSGTTARVVTVRIRRAGDNAVIGQPCVVRSQAIASSDFGPCAITAVDINPTAPGLVTYAVTATTPAGAASALRISLVAVEVQ
jgi:hypothetical protein